MVDGGWWMVDGRGGWWTGLIRRVHVGVPHLVDRDERAGRQVIDLVAAKVWPRAHDRRQLAEHLPVSVLEIAFDWSRRHSLTSVVPTRPAHAKIYARWERSMGETDGRNGERGAGCVWWVHRLVMPALCTTPSPYAPSAVRTEAAITLLLPPSSLPAWADILNLKLPPCAAAPRTAPPSPPQAPAACALLCGWQRQPAGRASLKRPSVRLCET